MSHAVRLAAKLALLLLLISPAPGFSTQTTPAALVEVTIDAIETAPAGAPATDHLVTVEQVLQGSVPGTSLIVRVPREERAPELRTGERVRLSLIPGNDGSFRIRRVERAGQEPAAVGRTDQDLPVTVALTLPFQTLQTGEAVPFQAGFTGPARSARWEIGAGALAFSDGPCAAETFCAHHIFTRPGTYRIRVTATGLQGQIAETMRTVFVEGDELRLTGRESLLQNVLSAPGGAQSDLRLYNAGEVPVLVRATFVPRGAFAGVREVTVSPGTSVFLPDVVAGLFGQRDQQGSLSLSYLLSLPDSDVRPLVFAYSRSAVVSAGASFGQLIPEEPESGWSAAERI
ncbi:MAG TPA: PKD domain-containing protein, partial [Thermoanaerobaculia bacterium]|nr:PKD domain-containing protein [Thermoanaerobaculia bacterium]